MTGTQCPTLFEKWHGILYMPSRTDRGGHTKAFIYPVIPGKNSRCRAASATSTAPGYNSGKNLLNSSPKKIIPTGFPAY